MSTVSSSSSHRPLPKPLIDLDLTIISAKHLKNVNWRNGDLTPYVIFWLDPDRRLATKSDESNSTKPIWNEKFTIPLPTTNLSSAVLTLEIFHSKPSDTPKPLVGTLRVLVGELSDLENSNRVRVFDIRRPSGRVHGKIRLKFGIHEHPLPDYQNYQNTPNIPYYYNNATGVNYGRIPSSPSPYGSYASLPTEPPAAAPVYVSSQSVPYSVNYNGGYYSQAPPQPAINRQFSYIGGNGGGPSAPMDYGIGQYDQKPRILKMGSGSGSGMGGITGGLAGLAIDEGSRYEDRKSVDRIETDTGVKKPEDYIYYRRVDY